MTTKAGEIVPVSAIRLFLVPPLLGHAWIKTNMPEIDARIQKMKLPECENCAIFRKHASAHIARNMCDADILEGKITEDIKEWILSFLSRLNSGL